MFEHVFKYNEDQERDERGRWVAVGFGKGTYGVEKVKPTTSGGRETVRSAGRHPAEFTSMADANSFASFLNQKPKANEWVEAPGPTHHEQTILAMHKNPSRQYIKQHNLDQISTLARDIKEKRGTPAEQMDRYKSRLIKFDEVIKAEGVDYSERARRAWETRARGGRTAEDARRFIHGEKQKVDPKVKALEAEVEKLKAQLKAKVFEASEKPAPKGKLPGLDTKQRESLFNYFSGGGPKDKSERAYYLARAKQIANGEPRPAHFSAKFGVERMRVGKVEGMLYFIQKGWRKKNGI